MTGVYEQKLAKESENDFKLENKLNGDTHDMSNKKKTFYFT